MSTHWNQSRSNLPRRGEPPSHMDSAQAVCNFVNEIPGYTAKQRKEIKFPDGYKHQFDIIVRNSDGKITHFVEVGDVGDDSKHQLPHKDQLINDGVAKAHVEEYYPSTKYLKINKEDCFHKYWVLKKKLGLLIS
jgi:hypothetical protein